MNIAILSTYPPRECGIASFSSDLRDNLIRFNENVEILAITDNNANYDYPTEVVFQINQDERASFISAAGFVNESSIDIVIIQHEYGIFGGPDGSYVLDFAKKLEKPFIVITHTVLPKPSLGQKQVLAELGSMAIGVSCMTKRAAGLLENIYHIPKSKLCVIPHGVPYFEPKDREYLKSFLLCDLFYSQP